MPLNYKPNGWELDVQQGIKEGTTFEAEFFPPKSSSLPLPKIQSPKHQLATLKRLFPDLKSKLPEISDLPKSAEGWLIMPFKKKAVCKFPFPQKINWG